MTNEIGPLMAIPDDQITGPFASNRVDTLRIEALRLALEVCKYTHDYSDCTATASLFFKFLSTGEATS